MTAVEQLAKRVGDIRAKIEKAKSTKANYEGQMQAETKHLKELGCDSIEKAEAEIARLDVTLPELEIKVATGVKDLEAKLLAIETAGTEA
jgi:ribosomal protein S25